MENKKFNIVSYNRKRFLESLDYFINIIDTLLNVECDCKDSLLSFNEFIALSNKIKELNLLVYSLSNKKY